MGVMVWFGSIFVKKMFKPMKSSPVRIGSVVTVFQKRNQTKLVGLDRFG